MPDLGLGEGIAALAASGALEGLLGGGAATGVAAAAPEAAAIGAADLGGAALAGAGAAEAGTGVAGLDAAAGGLGALGTGAALGPGGLTPAAAATSPFGTGFATQASAEGAITGVSGAAPAAPSAASFAAPAGVTGVTDLTSAGPAGVDAAGAMTASAPGTAPATSGFSFDSLIKGATDSVTKNPLGLAIAGGALGYDILQGQKQPQSVKDLQALAGPAAQQGQAFEAAGKTLTDYTASGTLPPGIQAGLDQQVAAAKQKIISNYAAQGINPDPAHNSSLNQELTAVDERALAIKGQLEQQLFQSGTSLIGQGISETGLSSNIYTTLANIDQTQSANVGKAIAAMAAALNPSRTTVQIGGTTTA